MMGIEPMTSSLPRKRSTPELHRQRFRVARLFRLQGEHHEPYPIKNSYLERETRFELATPTLEGLCSTN